MAAAIASLLKAKHKLANKEKQKQKSSKEDLIVAHVSHVVIMPFPSFPPKWVVSGKDGSESLGSKNTKSPSSLKKSMSRQDLLARVNKQSMSSDMESHRDDDGVFESSLRQAYSGVYIGLVLMAIGIVITFVGLGEKGFKTTELRLIGPILLLIGAICIVVKILQCSFPNLFKKPVWLSRSAKLSDNSIEKGAQNGHLMTNSSKSSPQAVGSPRVTLQSAKKMPRPRSTIPNFIEDSTDDEDDFDPGRPRPYPSQGPQYNNEIVLTPKTLML